jgi:hypothetical protein
MISEAKQAQDREKWVAEATRTLARTIASLERLEAGNPWRPNDQDMWFACKQTRKAVIALLAAADALLPYVADEDARAMLSEEVEQARGRMGALNG